MLSQACYYRAYHDALAQARCGHLSPAERADARRDAARYHRLARLARTRAALRAELAQYGA